MSRIVFATGNADKMVEIREILKDLGMANPFDEGGRSESGDH